MWDKDGININKMIVSNPTKSDIEVSIEGIQYNLPASGEIKGVREEHALYWKTKLHSFLVIKDEVIADVKNAVKEVMEAKEAVEKVVEDVKVIGKILKNK